MLQTRHQSCMPSPTVSPVSEFNHIQILWCDSRKVRGPGGVNCTSCKGYLWYTDPGAPASCRVCAHFGGEHTKWCMCADHCQLWSSDNRGQSASQSGTEKNDLSFSLSLSLHETFLSLYPNNYCQCSTWSLVSWQLLPEGSAARSSPFDKRSAIAEPLKAILVFH